MEREKITESFEPQTPFVNSEDLPCYNDSFFGAVSQAVDMSVELTPR